MSIDISNPLEWNLVYRNSLVAGASGTITPVVFTSAHHEIIVGIKVADEPTWRWGGYLTAQVDALPSSTAQLFGSLIQIKSYRLTCRQYQSIDLNPALPLPFVCQIDFPRYFRSCQVEVFARNDI
ncbi:hypothetical protein [Chamaesiphon sp. OTE_75_metabat_556]|uniref:hypothetical protein n=1 Tax=Chamaesiphon sp. OTE_75_metabat_556 TaxID=2964692 RepID=UPI00286B8760|nr:hypothetical protein [Chamaesiphon sp. OTE_75_metabat_556]